MNFWPSRWILVTALLLQSFALARSCAAQADAGWAQDTNQASLPEISPRDLLAGIPVPYDPLELVPRDARIVQNPEERASALELLQTAHRLSNVRLHPYDLKTSFTSYGSSSSDGPWTLEDIAPGGNVYRWTAQGPSFSGTFLTVEKLLSSNQPGGAMPLRLAQARDAMWAIYLPAIGPHATLRVANGYLNGAALRCVLVAHGFYGDSQPRFSSGRSFDEAEYCVNPQSGLLETYSPYAGLYIRYDYATGLHFHEQIVPDGFTITEQGKPVIEAKTENVSEPPPRNSNLFEPAGLKPMGVGQEIVAPLRINGFQSSPSVSAAGQVVVVHGMVTPEGRLTEVEVVVSTNPSLDDAAIEHANRAEAPQRMAKTQPGITPQSREAIFTVQFFPQETHTDTRSNSPQ